MGTDEAGYLCPLRQHPLMCQLDDFTGLHQFTSTPNQLHIRLHRYLAQLVEKMKIRRRDRPQFHCYPNCSRATTRIGTLFLNVHAWLRNGNLALFTPYRNGSDGRCRLQHSFALFITPPDGNAQPHCPDRYQQQERCRNEGQRLNLENLLEPDTKPHDS